MAQLPQNEIDSVIEIALEAVQQLDNDLNQLSIQVNEVENVEQQEQEQNRVRVSPYNGNVTTLCAHIFQRGPRVGQHCPNVICINSQTLCRTHYNNQQRRERRRQEREAQRSIEQELRQEFQQIIGRPRRDGRHVARYGPLRQPINEEQQVNNLPLIEEGLLAPPRPIRRRRNGRQRRVLPDFVIPSHPRIELFEEEKELIYEPCPMCSSKVNGAKVKLDCGCEYHLNCYLIIQNEENCMKCGDKINKTETDYHDCSICLEKLKTSKIKTSCGHEFHVNCINSWMRMGRGNYDKCPNCRGNIH